MVDPFDPNELGIKLPKIEAEALLKTHNHADHSFELGVSGTRLVIDGPGEYEIGGVHVLGIPTFHDEAKGSERGFNTMYLLEVDGFNILHCGDLGHELEKDMLEKLEEVDVLMIPVGGVYTIDAEKAAKVISTLEPSLVIPMHYRLEGSKLPQIDGLDKFLEEMGLEGDHVKEFDKLKLSTRSDLPSETQIVVLKY